MPTITEIRNAIVARLQGVAGIGVVHDRERYAAEQTAFRALFESNGKIDGWLVRRRATRRQSNSVGRWIVTHQWELRGYRGFEDLAASELAFDLVVEAIAAAIRDDDTLGGAVATCTIEDLDDVSGLQVEDSGPVLFCGVLCHSVKAQLYTRHFE